MESTIPPDMTCEEWRPRRSARLRPVPCDHVHESTSRYDRDLGQLTFLLVCPVCRTEKVIESLAYEPRFQQYPTTESPGATVHELPGRTHAQPKRRTA